MAKLLEVAHAIAAVIGIAMLLCAIVLLIGYVALGALTVEWMSDDSL